MACRKAYTGIAEALDSKTASTLLPYLINFCGGVAKGYFACHACEEGASPSSHIVTVVYIVKRIKFLLAFLPRNKIKSGAAYLWVTS